MEWVETFSHDEGKPSENDGDVKLWFQTRYQFETCTIFVSTVIIEDHCIKAVFCIKCIHMNVIELITVIFCSK